MSKSIKRIIRTIRPYCKDIRIGNNHWVCRPILGNRLVIISVSPSDVHFYKNVYKDFLRCGIKIPELLK